MKRCLLFTSFLAATANAAESSYTHLDIGYFNGEADMPGGFATFFGLEKDLDLEGFSIAARYEITNNFFAYAGFEDGEIEAGFVAGGGFELDFWRLKAGLGGYVPLAESLDLYYSFGYRWHELDDGFDSQRLGNVDLLIGLRWTPTGWVEINPYIEHSIGADDDDLLRAVDVTTAGINLYLTVFPYVQPFAGISYELDSSRDNLVGDLVFYSAGLRFSF